MESDRIYAINKSYRLINDTTKCVLYRVDDFFNSVDNITILKSYEAVVLAMFDGHRPLRDIYSNCRYIFPITDEIDFVDTIITSLEKRTEDRILVEAEELEESSIQTFDPEAYLIPRDMENSCPMDLRLSFPLSVNFNVSTQCPFSCRYCYHPLDYVPPTLTVSRIQTLAKELKTAGCESIMLTGGDPFCRKDIIDIMKAFHDVGMKYSISTKSILTHEQIDRMVDECKLDKIQFSLDSNDIDILSFLIGCNSSYLKRFEDMVAYLQEYGVEVRIKCVLTAYNYQGMYDFLEYAHMKLKSDNIQVVQYGRSGTRHKDDLFPSQEQLDIASAELSRFRKDYPLCTVVGGNFGCSYREPMSDKEKLEEPYFSKRSICNAGRFSMTILPNGEITVCEQLPYRPEYIIGSIADQSLHDCWNSISMKKWLSPPPRDTYKETSPCRRCSDDKYETCHKIYSRCLRFIWETTRDTDDPDINCPESDFERFRIT